MSSTQRQKLHTGSLKIAEMRSTTDSAVTDLSVSTAAIDLGRRDQYLYSQGVGVSVSESADATLTSETVKRKSKAELQQETRDKERKVNNIFKRMKKARNVSM